MSNQGAASLAVVPTAAPDVRLDNQRMVGQLTHRPLEALRPSKENPRTHSQAQLARMAESMRTFGWVAPILATATGEIIAGEARWRAAKLLGLKSAPVVTVEHLSAAEVRAYRIADNRLALDAGWDEAKLTAVLADLAAKQFDVGALGFSDRELSDLLAAASPAKPKRATRDPDAAPEPPAEPVTRLGDVWQLGPHRLICGDSTKAETVATLLAGDAEKPSLVFTDPPYGMSFAPRSDTRAQMTMVANDDLRGAALVDFIGSALTAAKRAARRDAAYYVCSIWRTFGEFSAALERAGLTLTWVIVWDKESVGLGQSHYRPQFELIMYVAGAEWFGDRAQSDVWPIGRDGKGGLVHPTQKPVALIDRALQNSSRYGSIVLDVFGGSGSTLIACEAAGRVARLVELEPKYCDAIVRRWEEFTGQRAERVPADQPDAGHG